ncbi:MAG: type II secretion system protein GspC [Steroidobacteraceae bacterium]
MSFSATLRELQTLSGQQWLDRATRTLPQALTVVLVVAIAWQLVQLTWLLLERRAPADAGDMVMAPPPAAAARKGIDVQAIATAHLFGMAQAEQAAPEDAQPTQMNLVLSAVFAANDPTKGLAVIGESPQSAKVYAVGSVVRPGTKLHSVYLDRVLLDRNGQLETLSLPKPSTAGIAITRTAPAPRPGGGQFADNLRRIAETNPTAFAEIVRPQPVFANGVQRGYRVYPGRNRQQFAKLGLQPGDLVLSINGTPLDDPQRGMEIFNTISTSDRVTVTVERNGQPQELTLNTAQIMLPDANSPPPGRTGQQRPIPTPAFTPEPE